MHRTSISRAIAIAAVGAVTLGVLVVAGPAGSAEAGGPGVTVTVGVDPAAPVAGQNVEYHATVTDPSRTPVGDVQFVIDGNSLDCPDTSVHDGVATCPAIAPAAGSVTLSASYVSSDGADFSASREVPITVAPAAALRSSVVVGDPSAGALTSFPQSVRTGDALPTTTVTGLDSPTALAFDPAGNLWVADCNANTIAQYPATTLAATSSAPARLTLASPSSGVLSCPSGIAFDQAGDLWVSTRLGPLLEYRASQLRATGTSTQTPVVQISNDSAGDLADPAGIAFDDFGDLWVASFSGSRLAAYGPTALEHSGAPSPSVVIGDDGSGALGDAEQLAFDAAGDLWVAASRSSEVLEYRAAHLTASGTPAPDVVLSDDGSGDLTNLRQLAFDDGGNLWVAGEFSGVVLKYTPAQLAHTAAPSAAVVLTGHRTGLLAPGALAAQRTPPSAPGAPQAVRLTAGVRQVALSWGAPSNTGGSHLTGYRVLRSTNRVSWTTVTATTATIHSATDTGLVGGTRYYYAVEALNRIGASVPSPALSAIAITTPGAPLSVRATAGNRQVSLSWAAPTATGGSAITGYRVLRSTNGTTWTTAATTSAHSYRSAGLAGTKRYYFAVEALNRAGASKPSFRVSAVPYSTASAPRALAAHAAKKALLLTWSAPASTGGVPITGYLVQWAACRIGAKNCVVHTVSVRAPTLRVKRLSPKHRYHLRVQALNRAGRGAFTRQRSAVPLK